MKQTSAEKLETAVVTSRRSHKVHQPDHHQMFWDWLHDFAVDKRNLRFWGFGLPCWQACPDAIRLTQVPLVQRSVPQSPV